MKLGKFGAIKKGLIKEINQSVTMNTQTQIGKTRYNPMDSDKSSSNGFA